MVQRNIQNKRFYLVMGVVVCITILDSVALINGIDGVVMTTSIGIITGLVALVIPTPKQLKMRG
jgi:hypothetical protein